MQGQSRVSRRVSRGAVEGQSRVSGEWRRTVLWPSLHTRCAQTVYNQADLTVCDLGSCALSPIADLCFAASSMTQLDYDSKLERPRTCGE